MNFLARQFGNSPVALRVAPFVIFLALTFCQDLFGESGRYWIYLLKTLIGAWMIAALWSLIPEMRWKPSLEGFAVGTAVFGLWVGLEGLYPTLDTLMRALAPLLKAVGLESWTREQRAAAMWNPFHQFGPGSGLAWFFVVVRIVGSTLVVPPLEEVFYRSFLYRYLSKARFDELPLGQFRWGPFLITSGIFGFAHREWLAGILCGLAYQGLVCSRKRLGDAMTAHAVTNFLLGIWVVWRNAWNFW